jgi:hypothetical protein
MAPLVAEVEDVLERRSRGEVEVLEDHGLRRGGLVALFPTPKPVLGAVGEAVEMQVSQIPSCECRVDRHGELGEGERR